MNQSRRIPALGLFILLACFVGRACTPAPSVWRIETVDSDKDEGHSLSLSLDKANHPHISYREYPESEYTGADGNLKYAYYNGALWEIEVIEDKLWDTGADPSLALDKDGRPHISYGGYTREGRGALKYIYHDGFTWQPIEVIDYVRYVTCLSSLALDEANQVHVSYFDDASGTLKYARRSGSTWVVDIVDEVGPEGGSISLALDSLGHPHITYYHPYYNLDQVDGHMLGGVLKHAYSDGSTWIVEVVDDVGDSGAYSSLALDTQDRPHISYQDWGNNLLKYAWHDGTTWQIEMVDAGEGVGSYSSLALDSSSRPHISYLANKSLKYAYYDGSRWQIETIDEIGRGWTSISLALDQAGRAYVAYYDRTQQDLKYAHRTSAP